MRADVFVSILLFLIIPSIYLSFFKKKYILKIALFSIITTIPFAILVDYVMELTGGWFLPKSFFGSFRLFHLVTLEQIIWLFFYLYFVTIFYEVFLEKQCTHKLRNPRSKYLVIIMMSTLAIFIFMHAFTPSLLYINFFYLKFGIIAVIIPLILFFVKFSIVYKNWRIFYLSFINLRDYRTHIRSMELSCEKSIYRICDCFRNFFSY